MYMEINENIYNRACFLLGVNSCNTVLIQEEEEKAEAIASYIHCMKEKIKDFEVSGIISYLNSNRIKYILCRYIGLILVKEYAVNPFDIYESLVDYNYYSMEAFFRGTFEYAPYVSNERLLEIIDRIYSKTLAHGIISPVLTDMVNYFKSNTRQLHELFVCLLQKPSHLCLWLICQKPEYLAEPDSESFSALMGEYARSENPLVLSAFALIAKEVLYDLNLKFDFKEIVSVVISKFKKYFNDREYVDFISNCIPLAYCLVKYENGYDDLISLLHIGIASEKIFREKLLIEMESRFYDWEGIGILDFNFALQICQNIDAQSEQKAVMDLDLIIEKEINTGNIKQAWQCICEFSTRNKKCDLEKMLNSSFSAIANRLEEFLPLIYGTIFNASSADSLGFKVLMDYKFINRKDVDSVDWTKGLTCENVIPIAKKIVVSILNADFVIGWFLSLFQNKELNSSTALYEIFETWVCRNYPVSVIREVEGFLEKTKCEDMRLRKTIENCEALMEKQDEVLQMKDFTPDHSRVIKYRIEEKRAIDTCLKKAEEDSPLLKLTTKIPIKYGNRFGSLQKEASKFKVNISEYMVNQSKYEPAFAFSDDPLFFSSCFNDAFKDIKS